MDPEALAERVRELPWYHQIDLGSGVVTPGIAPCTLELPRLRLPAALDGQTVLDIGAWDGFYSFEAARRGAARVLATDSYSWDGRGWGSKKAFDLARAALGLEGLVEDQLIDPMEISPSSVGGTFDVVLHLGVLYHLRDPVTSLELAAAVCDDLLVLETETALNFLPYEAARFYSGDGLNRDSTNWFQFNSRALEGILRECGFRSISIVHQDSQDTGWKRAYCGLRWRRAGRSAPEAGVSSRIVIHARKQPMERSVD